MGSWVYRRPHFRAVRRLAPFGVPGVAGEIFRATTEDVEIHEEAFAALALNRAVDEDVEIREDVRLHFGRTAEETEEIEEEVFAQLGFAVAHDELVEIGEEVGVKFGETVFASMSFDSAVAGPQDTDDAQGGAQAVG